MEYGCEFGNFRQKISGNISWNSRKFVNYLCQSAVSKSSIAKWCRKISVFVTNNRPDLYTLTLHIILRKNNLFLARLPEISANLNENYRRCNFQPSANIFGKFPEVLNFWKIYNPTWEFVIWFCSQEKLVVQSQIITDRQREFIARLPFLMLLVYGV